MNSRTSRFLILLGVLSLALLTPEFLAQEAEVVENTAKASRFVGTLWAILPPIIAIGLALITKEVYTSLFIGIFFGCLLITNFKPIESIDVVIQTGIIPAVQVGAGIFIFLVTLGVIAALLSRTGSAAAFGKWARQHVKTRCGAQLATFFLGVLIFIDDYFNCLTVGNVMRPVTDAHRISRAKLAYIIDATAAPVCMIAPISSWAAAVSNFTKGTEYNGIQLFIHAIPFNFYSLLTFVFILAIVLLKLDYGPMAIHEKNAFEKGDLFTSGGEVGDDMNPIENSKGKFIDLVLPVVVLVITCVWGLMRAGGYGTSTHRIMDAFANTDASLGLSAGGLVALIFTIAYLLLRRVISAKEAFKCIPSGFIAMVPAILILTLATSLKEVSTSLGLANYIADTMQGNAGHLGAFLPAVIFLVACFLAFSTGTAWGTFGILIPIVCNIFPGTDPLFIIGISACLAGAVFGDHCSLISDTTIMSSAGARCEHVNHVSTQLPYALTVAAVSFIGFLLAGFIKKWSIVFPITVVLLLVAIVILKVVSNKKMAANRA